MTGHVTKALILTAVLALSLPAAADSYMGQYVGTFHADKQAQVPVTAVVVAEAEDRYRIRIETTDVGTGRDGATVEVYGHARGGECLIWDRSGGYHWNGGIKDGRLAIRSAYSQRFELNKVVRKSPKEGLKPPAGAVVLLPYKKGVKPDLSAWTNQNWKALEAGTMQVNKGATRTKERFGDIKHLHLEFRLPLEPLKRGQGRGNSGLFLNDAYEVQILDSFGLVETAGDCGSLYAIKRPDVNASLPPLTWQTYDIEFRAPRLNDDGSVKEAPRITVYLNGVKIHSKVEIPHPTANPKAKSKATGPLQLQDHGHPIQFRNIWLVKG